MAKVGYKRVSSWEQRTDRQLEGVELDEVFEDHASGKDLNRPQCEVTGTTPFAKSVPHLGLEPT